ncbi:MAG: hypothetical protein Q9221_008888 [Calogaya cf. arnoldii]
MLNVSRLEITPKGRTPIPPPPQAKRGEMSGGEEIDAKLEDTMHLPPDPTRQKKISLFTRRHKFITEQSLGTYTTTQRRTFERDVYDFARALGFSKARAKASMLVARTFCGEEDYDTDDTRLDDDEMDDSSEVLVSLPLSTGTQTSHSSFARSFSANSPAIPWSGNPARTGSEVLPSVEVRETPQSEGGKSKRTRKRVEDSSSGPKGKRRKTDSEIPTGASEYNDDDPYAGLGAAESMALQRFDKAQPQHEAPHEPSRNEVTGKSPSVTKVLEHQITNGTRGEPSAVDEKQAKDGQPETAREEKSQENSKGKKAKGKKQQSTPTIPSKTPNKGRKKRKSEHIEPMEQSAPSSAQENHAQTDGLNDIGYRGALETSPKLHDQDARSNGVVTIGADESHQVEEQSDLARLEPQEEKERNDVRLLPDEEKGALRRTKKGNFDEMLERLEVLEAQKKTKKEDGHDVNKHELLEAQQKKTTKLADEQKGDNSFDMRAQELLRAQDAARRAREEQVKTEESVDGGKDKLAESKKAETPLPQRKEKKMTKREMKKKRQAEGANAAEHEIAYAPNEAHSFLPDTERLEEEMVYERPSTPIRQHVSSAASSPLSSLPSTPPWPTPSRNTIKEEVEEKPKPKRHQNRSKTTASGLTPTKRSKSSSKVSPYFASPKPPRQPISCIPFPPLSSTSFGLVQESLQSNPFHLLIAVIFLNKTRGAVALPVFYDFITRFPNPTSLAGADLPEVVGFFQNLGLQNQRAKKCIGLAKAWLQHPPIKGKRWRRLHYPKLGDGKDIKSNEVPIADEDPRVGWEVGHLPGIGAYGIDSWRIFCRDELRELGTAALPELPAADGDGDRGVLRKELEEKELKREWTRILPMDKELRAYLRWRWLRLGWDWDPKTGERRVADEGVMRGAEKGGVICEGEGESLENNGLDVVRRVGESRGVEHGDGDGDGSLGEKG